MFKLTWKFNGRTIPANRIADELGKAVRSKATDAAKQAMARVRCPVHGTGPRNLRVSGALVHNSRSRSIIALHPEIRGPA